MPVLPATEGGSLLLGPGAEELADALGVDLLGVLEPEKATGKAGEVTTCPVPLGIADNPALRLVLLVGVGDQTPRDLRRAGAALARAVPRPHVGRDLGRGRGRRRGADRRSWSG